MMGHTCKYTDTLPATKFYGKRHILEWPWQSENDGRLPLCGPVKAVAAGLFETVDLFWTSAGCLSYSSKTTKSLFGARNWTPEIGKKTWLKTHQTNMQNLPSLSISECCTQKRNRKNSTDSTIGMWWTWIWYDSFVTLSQSNVAMDNHTKNKNPHGKTIIIYNRGFSWIFQPCITVSGIDP